MNSGIAEGEGATRFARAPTELFQHGAPIGSAADLVALVRKELLDKAFKASA
jgi:hypothetical protein